MQENFGCCMRRWMFGHVDGADKIIDIVYGHSGLPIACGLQRGAGK